MRIRQTAGQTFKAVIGLCLLFLFGCGTEQRPGSARIVAKEALDSLPMEHRKRLEIFFTNLLINSGMAYTLFGSKPWSVESYMSNQVMRSSLIRHPQCTLDLAQGWESWLRYQHLFPSHTFLLRRISSEGDAVTNMSTHTVVVINKPATLQMIQRHLSLFQKILKTNATANDILMKIESSDSVLAECFDSNELLGTLLGYGAINAHAFVRRNAICRYLNQCLTPPSIPKEDLSALSPRSRFFVSSYKSLIKMEALPPNPLLPSPGLASLVDELNGLCEGLDKHTPKDPEVCIDHYARPVFVLFEKDPETTELLQSYAKTRAKLSTLLDENPILETVFTQWTSHHVAETLTP